MKFKNYDTKKVIIQMAKFNIKGNIVDRDWFKNLTYKNGKPNMNAIIILSEIVYWYRPKVVKCGNIYKLKKKFNADMLQKSYQDLADKFNLSKRQVKSACDFLKEKGLIDIEFRDIVTTKGKKLNNVMYIALNPEKLFEISCMHKQDAEKISNEINEDRGEEYYIENPQVSKCSTVIPPSPSFECTPPPTIGCTTYTESTCTESTNKNNNNTIKIHSKYKDTVKPKKTDQQNVVVNNSIDLKPKNTSLTRNREEDSAKQELLNSYKESAITFDNDISSIDSVIPDVLEDIVDKSQDTKKDQTIPKNRTNSKIHENTTSAKETPKVVSFQEKKEISAAKKEVVALYQQLNGHLNDILRILGYIGKLTLSKLQRMKKGILYVKSEYVDKGRKIKNLPGLVYAAYKHGYENQAVDPALLKSEKRIAEQRRYWEEWNSQPVASRETSTRNLQKMIGMLKGKKPAI